MFLGHCAQTEARGQAKKRIFVGTYTEKLGHVDGKGRGIYSFLVDEWSGQMRYEGVTKAETNPTYLLALGDDTMIAVMEKYDADGTIASYAVNSDTGALKLRNEVSAQGKGTCHVSVSPDRKFIGAANYMGGSGNGASFVVHRLENDGSIGENTATVSFASNCGPVAARQEQSHAHGAFIPSTGNVVLVPDLGNDRIVQMGLASDGKVFGPVGQTRQSPGAGPRHIALHPNQRLAFVVNELDNTIAAHPFDKFSGTFGRALYKVKTQPEGVGADASGTTAAIRVSPNGKYVIASNRMVGRDGILSTFRVDPATGRMEAVGYTNTGGETPRDFMFLNQGLVLAANQDSDSIVAFRMDPDTGVLIPTGAKAHCPSPVAIVAQGE